MSTDAEGRETKLVTLDDFAKWIVGRLYADGQHENAVEVRFVREQSRHVANAALQQAAQHVIRKFGPAWSGVAQEILTLRTRESDAETYGEIEPVERRVSMVVPIEEYAGEDGEDAADDVGAGAG